jgi:hypothetical protein
MLDYYKIIRRMMKLSLCHIIVSDRLRSLGESVFSRPYVYVCCSS